MQQPTVDTFLFFFRLLSLYKVKRNFQNNAEDEALATKAENKHYKLKKWTSRKSNTCSSFFDNQKE